MFTARIWLVDCSREATKKTNVPCDLQVEFGWLAEAGRR